MAPASAKRKRTVFLVDDHALVREWLTNLIHQQPDLAVCGEAADVQEAVKKITASKPDIVVVDISLKGPSGIELVKELKHCWPEVAVLVLSMHEGASYVERALLAGANGYVMKRESATKVIEAMHRILEDGFYISEETGRTLANRFFVGRARTEFLSVEQFSGREREIFELLGEGKTPIQMAEKLQIDVKTVHTYCARIREKLHLNSTVELLREAFRWYETHHSSR